MALHKLSNGVEIDLEAEKLLPLDSHIKERGKLQSALDAASRELQALQSGSSINALRLQLAQGAPDERTTKQLMAAYKADIEGNDKPPTIGDWLQGDGKLWASALKPVATTTPPATPPAVPPAATPPAAAPPNTSTTAVPASPPTKATPDQVKKRAAEIVAERKIAVQQGDTKKAAALKEEHEALFRALAPNAA